MSSSAGSVGGKYRTPSKESYQEMKDELRKINERMENDRADMVRMLEEMNRRSREDEERRAREGLERRMMEENERRRREEQERRRRERDDRRRRAHGERTYTPSYGSEESYYEREGERRRGERREIPRNREQEGRNVKVKLPKFNGSGGADAYFDWTMKVDQVFSCYQLDEMKKIRLATLEFEGYAVRK